MKKRFKHFKEDLKVVFIMLLCSILWWCFKISLENGWLKEFAFILIIIGVNVFTFAFMRGVGIFNDNKK